MNRIAFSRLCRAVALGSAVMGFAACSNNNSVTTPTTTSTTSSTTAAALEVYSGTLSPRSSGFYAFQATGAANATFTLASITNPTTGRPVSATLQMGVGVPAGEGCSVATSVAATPGLVAQLTAPVVVGTYCVQVADAGSLTAAVNFAVRIQRP